MTPAAFAREFPVSRETLERLEIYIDLLKKWNCRINLVSKASMDVVWQRHILDSAQLYPLSEHRFGDWVDLGSGGGLPGIVIAVLAMEDRRFSVTLVESDSRKAIFLQQVVSTLALPAKVVTARIEHAPPVTASVVSARALASLSDLLVMSQAFVGAETRLLFPKGRNLEAELTVARETWHIEAQMMPSRSDPEGRILVIEHYRAK